ncbi:MAG: phosphonoacetaldehyde reductase [Chitinophagaceae bacterium]
MQKLIQGENSIRQVAAEIKSTGYTSVFLVTGKHFREQSDTSFLDGLAVNHFIKSGTNVTGEEIDMAYKEFCKDPSQAILAIGGGSVIDIAKAVIYQCIESLQPVPYFAAAPTTAGSGSEATQFAVIYRDKKKLSLVHEDLLPKLAILDPSLTTTLPAYQTAVSGIDVFAQAVESYWNKNATEESKQYAVDSISTWKDFYIKLVKEPDIMAREKMLLSAYLSGKAINITRTTGPHALSYYLTVNHDIPHGQAVALFLPVFFFYNHPPAELYSLLGVKDAVEAKQFIQQKLKEAGLANSFGELGIKKESILESLLDEVNEERFANNPSSFDREQLKELIREHL